MDKQNTKDKVINRIQSELLSTLFKYIVPFIERKIEAKESNLEKIINNSKPKINLNDVKELESLLVKKFQSKNKKISIEKKLNFFSNNFGYSLNLTKKKEKNKSSNYSISLNYEENRTEEKLAVSVKKSENEIYSAEIVNKKDAKDKFPPYKIIISYEENYAEERLSITYKQQLRSYLHQHIVSKEDMTNRVPLKWLNILPETMMGGVLGFTYLGENFMARRADLSGKTARMVDIHESIHTPDEYETRVLTSWIMEKVRNKYIK